jgi:hypothetical protein
VGGVEAAVDQADEGLGGHGQVRRRRGQLGRAEGRP